MKLTLSNPTEVVVVKEVKKTVEEVEKQVIAKDFEEIKMIENQIKINELMQIASTKES